jgi:hypothetical protein
MRFKNWLLLQENIIVNTGNGDAVLGKSRESNGVVEFSYGAGDYYSSFEVWPFSEERPGYVKLSDGAATVVGIIKKTPIEPGNGADRAFIKSLAASLAASGLKPLPYKEGDSAWMGAMSAAGVDDDHPAMKGMKGEKEFSSTSTPEMGKASSNAKKATAGVSFGRMSGSWAYFIRVNPGSATFQIDKIVGAMKKAAQPLVDNDIIEQYRIVKGWNYKAAETVWSNKGKQEHDDDATKIKKSAAYIKFLADKMLANHPKAREQVYKYFRHSWDKDISPENTKVPLSDLAKYVNWQHNESPYLTFFLDALKGDNDRMYDVMEDASKTPDADEAIRRYKEVAEEEYDYMIENPRLWMTGAIGILSLSGMMSKYASGQFERFKRGYEAAINDWIQSGEAIRPSDLEYLERLSEFIEVKSKDQIKDAREKHKKAEEEHNKKTEEEFAKTKEMMKRGDFKYIVSGKDASWQDIPQKYINRYDELDVGAFALGEDIVDGESILHSAHEKASEDAYADAEEKKSETYGQDRSEVESDIDYEWDDYMDNREFEEGEFDGLSDEEKKEKVKEDYLDDFVDWKKSELKGEEERESWKYEPEPDESKIREYEDKFAEERAYEDGLVWMRWTDGEPDDIEVFLHSKNYEKAKPMVRKSISSGMEKKDKYGEPLISGKQNVSFEFVDDGSPKSPTFKARDI